MGVQGLWQLLQPVARPIKIETLEGKRLAIDSSLWLYHFQMAMRDKDGRTLSNAHILGFLWRILKLLFHGVRPVFVFDGGAPAMKRKTLSGRKARKQGAKESHARTAEKLLAAQMRQAAVKHVADSQNRASSSSAAQVSTSQYAVDLGENTVYFDDLHAANPRVLASRDLQSTAPTSSAPASRDKSSSPTKSGGRKMDWHKDPYALPALEEDLDKVAAANGRNGRRKDYRFATEDELRAVMSTIAPEDLDTNSDLFRSLPAELQYELVGDLRAQSRMTSYKRLQSMLATAPTPIDFSRAQIAGLKTRNDLTQKVLTVTDEIGNANIKVPIRVAGQRNKEYVLVRNQGAEGGFVLGVRDAGMTQDKAIDVDYEPEDIVITDDEAQRSDSDSDPEIEMDEVEIPVQPSGSQSVSRTADPELDQLQTEADPYKRKEKALELLQARAKYHAKQKSSKPGIQDDDNNQLERTLRPQQQRQQRPLFIRNRRTTAAESSNSPDQTDWIDVDADSDDDNHDFHRMPENDDDELDEDEAEDLAWAIAESQTSNNPSRAKEPSPPLRGLKLAHRSGEPISLHDAMSHRQQSTQSTQSPVSSSRAPDLHTSQTDIAAAAGAQDAESFEINEDDFEDVQPEAPSTLREVQPVVEPQPLLDAFGRDPSPADMPDRMHELAALVGRGRKFGGEFAGPPPPPRKSLAGSLRAARRSTSTTDLREQSKPMPSPDTSIKESEKETQSETPPRPPIANAGHMGPPLRSASQQRLERAAMRPKSVTPAEATARTLHEDLSPTPEEVNPQIAVDLYADEAKDDADFKVIESAPLKERSDSRRESRSAQSKTLKNATVSTLHGQAGESMVASDAAKTVDAVDSQVAQQEEPEETGVPVSLSVPEVVLNGAQGPGITKDGADVEAKTMDNVPSASTEHTVEPTSIETAPIEGIEKRSSRQQTPIGWSPTPSPEPEAVVIGADGFPLPTAEELDALDAEDQDEIARLNADQNEFVAFLSATKGRSLLDVQKQVASEVNALRAEFANSRRSEEDITKQMAQEIQMMLRLFGLPYITAPMEAEAQCAELVSRRLVDGIITDDSDVFLFGGTRVYKNMFNNNKIVECFLLSDMQRELGLDREKLVQLAYYLGSDYTEGLVGVGPVVAMELLALFPGQDGLLKFRDWWMRVQMGQDTEEHTRGKTMRRIKRNLHNKVHLEPSWPEHAVLDAYFAPTVDESDEPFAWGLPDLDSLRTFLGEYLHWPVTKTDQYLLPIIERQNTRNRARGNQTTLDRNAFFDASSGTGVYAGRKTVTYASNRLQEVINGFRAANKARKGGGGEAERRRARGGNSSSSSSSDGEDEFQVVDARMQTPVVAEEMLGKQMGRTRRIVRRDEGAEANGGARMKDAQTSEARQAELDAAIEALENATGAQGSTSSASSASKRKKKRTKQAKGQTDADAQDGVCGSACSASSADEAVVVAKTARWTRGRRGRSTAARARSMTGRGSKARANLNAARNMSLDDVHSLPPSRSASLDPAVLRARSTTRSRSASSNASAHQ